VERHRWSGPIGQETAVSGKFEISKDKAGKYRFHLKAAVSSHFSALL
jgi:hypothetical protein